MDSKFSAIIIGSNSGKIYSGEHYTLDSIIPDFYLSQNGLSITGFDETENVVSTIKLDTTSTPTISSNKNSLLSTNQGFYLGYDGLSIGANFIILSSGIATISQQGSKVGGWDFVGASSDQKLASSGSGVLLDSENSRIMLGGQLSEIYSNRYTNLSS